MTADPRHDPADATSAEVDFVATDRAGLQPVRAFAPALPAGRAAAAPLSAVAGGAGLGYPSFA